MKKGIIFILLFLISNPLIVSAQLRSTIIDWSIDNTTDIQGYKIYYSYNSNMANQKVACQTSDPTATELTCENVDIEKYPVYFTVAAIMADSESVSSPKIFSELNELKIVSFIATPNPSDNPRQTIHFTIEASDPDGDVLSYSIDFGDDTSSSSGNLVTHAYKNKGIYSVTATVTDNHGHSVSKTLQVVVNDNKPVKVTGVHAQ